jgi:pyrimidine-specific ribonucleoside hydrolase
MAIPLIIDTDPGVDDAFALALAARSPEVDLLGVTTVFGNVSLEHTTRNAQRVLALLGRTDVPVAAGAARALGEVRQEDARVVHGDDGLSGLALTLPENDLLDPRDAVTFLRETIEASREPVTVAAIGPLTNIAALLETGTKIGRLVLMGGGIGQGNVTEKAEFNIWSDAEAARRVFRANPTLVPINLTRRCSVDRQWLENLRGHVGERLHALTAAYRDYYFRATGLDGILVHDAIAVAEAVRPGVLTTRPHLLDVDCSTGPDRGAVIAGDHEVRVAEDTDVDALRDFLRDRLSG